jgi:type I restriction enzyme S subunit
MGMSEVNVPKLRFGEFEGEWVEKMLGEISILTSSKRVYLSDYTETGIPFYRGKEISELKLGITPKDILYISEDIYNKYKSKYGVPEVNDLLITAVGTLGNVLKINDNNPFYFKDGNLIWIKNITENSNFLIPQKSEQQKIAKFLTSTDQKITQTTQALEQMKRFKKGLLQGMFV